MQHSFFTKIRGGASLTPPVAVSSGAAAAVSDSSKASVIVSEPAQDWPILTSQLSLFYAKRGGSIVIIL